MILYELLTGRRAVPRLGAGGRGPDPDPGAMPPSTHRADLDPRLEAICLKAMAKRAGDRYPSMGELAAALSDFLRSPLGSLAPMPTTATSVAPAAVASQLPQAAASNSLIDRSLDPLTENQASPQSRVNSAPSTSPRPFFQRLPPPRTVLAAVLGLGVLLIGGIIFVTTERRASRSS